MALFMWLLAKLIRAKSAPILSFIYMTAKVLIAYMAADLILLCIIAPFLSDDAQLLP